MKDFCDDISKVDRENYGSTRLKWFMRGFLVSCLPMIALGYYLTPAKIIREKPVCPGVIPEIVCGPPKKEIEYVPVPCISGPTKADS